MREEQEVPMSFNEAIAYVEAEKRDNTPIKSGHKTVMKHEETANAAIKLIMQTPMKQIIREIMVMRVANPVVNKKAMSHLEIALATGMLEREVFKLEMEGIQLVRRFLEKTSISDTIGKFNKESKPNEVNRSIY